MSRAIGDNELALFGGEETIGNVDSNALFALGRKAINKQCKVNLLTLRTDAFGIRLQSLQLIFKDHFAVIQQPPDQRRFAVIHRSASDET